MQNLIKETLYYFNFMAEQIAIDGHLLAFNKDRTVCIIGVPAEQTLTVWQWIENEWTLSFSYKPSKAFFDVHHFCTMSSVAINDTGNFIAIGYINNLTDVKDDAGHKGACLLLSLLTNGSSSARFSSLIENTVITPDKNLSHFGEQVRFASNNRGLFVSSPDYSEEKGTIQNGAVFVYSGYETRSVTTETAIIPIDLMNVECFGSAIATNLDNTTIAVSGSHECFDHKDESYSCFSVTTFSSDGDEKIQELLIDHRIDEKYIYRMSFFAPNQFVIMGVVREPQGSAWGDKVFDCFNTRQGIIFELKDGKLQVVSENSVVVSQKELGDSSIDYDLQTSQDLSSSDMPTIGEQVQTMSNLKQEIGLGPITQPGADTDRLKMDKDKTMLRHHLILQQLLNNISIAVKNKEPVNIRIKGLEITPERVKISLLEFVNHGESKEKD